MAASQETAGILARRGYRASRSPLSLAFAALIGVTCWACWHKARQANHADASSPAKAVARSRDLAWKEHEEQSEPTHGWAFDIPEVEPTDTRPGRGGIVIQEGNPAARLPGRPMMLAQAGDPMKQLPPIIDFEPPNPLIGKEKKGPIVTTPPAPRPAVSPTVLPGPRALPPFGWRQVRLPLLGDPVLAAQGKVAPPTSVELEHFNKYVTGLVDPTHTLEVIQGRAHLLILKAAPKRVQVAAEGIITCTIYRGTRRHDRGRPGRHDRDEHLAAGRGRQDERGGAELRRARRP